VSFVNKRVRLKERENDRRKGGKKRALTQWKPIMKKVHVTDVNAEHVFRSLAGPREDIQEETEEDVKVVVPSVVSLFDFFFFQQAYLYVGF